jgi:dihydroorotate dehydrogenase (fumarate)/dihydroorotate dehydrogenase
MSLYSSLLRPLLFRLDAERAHRWSIEVCRAAGSLPIRPTVLRRCLQHDDPGLHCVFPPATGKTSQGSTKPLRFENPLGLAAGWDKSGRALCGLSHLGFGFAEIGSVSAYRSAGNPKPRLFRMTAERAIIVNYGLPNDGALVVARRMSHRDWQFPIGINVVKTNYGPHAPPCNADEILADYERSVTLLNPYCDYLTLNLSCPNTRGGKEFFAEPGNIRRLLERLDGIALRCPVFLKVAPVDDPARHDQLLDQCDPFPWVRGFAFNLPSGRPESLSWNLRSDENVELPGAVAGKPVSLLINRCIAGLYARMNPKRHIIMGAGGVFTAEDAFEKICLGASLVQLYTALVFEGPGVVKRINRGLSELMRASGYKNVQEAVGSRVTLGQPGT